jgi:protein tyrosine/serine phosphatase
VPWDGNESDAEIFAALKIKTIVDLRDKKEKDLQAEHSSPVWGLGMKVIDGPITNKKKEMKDLWGYLSCCSKLRVVCCACCCKQQVTQSCTTAFAKRGMDAMYISILESSREKILGVLQIYLEPDNYPILWHCSAGKDRTGVIAALLLASLGASQEAIIDDYNTSEEWLDELEVKFQTHPLFGGVLSAGQREEIKEHILRCQRSWMESVLAHLDQRYGSVLGYLDDIGFDAASRSRFQALNRANEKEQSVDCDVVQRI